MSGKLGTTNSEDYQVEIQKLKQENQKLKNLLEVKKIQFEETENVANLGYYIFKITEDYFESSNKFEL